VNEVVAAEPSGRDIGKDREPALRELCGALRHGRRLDNGQQGAWIAAPTRRRWNPRPPPKSSTCSGRSVISPSV
jgi:hypothetical protein